MRIEAKNLTYIYGLGLPWEKKAVDDVSFEVEEGEFVALIGETGSGKSTLVQLLTGLLKPNSGQVLVDGRAVFQEPKALKEIRSRIGLVFQFPEEQLFAETVYEDVAFGPRNIGVPASEIDSRVEEALLKVGLNPNSIRDRSPFSLSGGEKRLVAIAGVLAMEPKVLILDEVTAGLDPKGKKDILARIQLLHAKEKATIVMVSHDMDEVVALVERVIILKNGKKTLDGSPKEIFSHPELVIDQGLALPTLPRLFWELQKCGWDVPSAVFDLREAVLLLVEKAKDATL